MKFALVGMLSAGFAFAGDQKAQGEELRRLESVTWDLKTHTLSWVVQKGDGQGGRIRTDEVRTTIRSRRTMPR